MKIFSKKFLSSVMVLMIILNIGILSPSVVFADSSSTDFVIDNNGVLTGYNGTQEDVVIPTSVKSISVWAFLGNVGENIKSIEIPASVTNIDDGSFAWCDKLASINVDSNNANYLSENGILFDKQKKYLIKYGEAKNDTSYSIPSSVIGIKANAFKCCHSLTHVTIPNSVSDIDCGAFYECIGLIDITIPSNVSEIKENTFENCNSLKDITLSEGVKHIDRSAFEGCSAIENLILPNSVTDIGSDSFTYCSGLKSITLSDGLTSIGDSVFTYCSSMTSITIPGNVTQISQDAFHDCPNLENINVDVNNKRYYSKDGVLFDKVNVSIYKYPEGRKNNSYVIPDDVKGIGMIAFENNKNLSEITIPSSVICINSAAFSGCDNLTQIEIPYSVAYICNGAFSRCNNLECINVDTNNKIYKSDNGVLINKDLHELVNFPPKNKMTSYDIKSDIKTIDRGAFEQCNSLTNVTIASGVTTIAMGAFYYCTNLTSITIPDSVTNIEQGAFMNCTNLKLIVDRTSYAKTYAVQNNIPYKFSIMYGDVNGDSKVDASDYLYLKRYINGSVTVFPYEDGAKASDLNGDGKIDQNDYTLLRQFLIHKISKLPVQ